MLIILGFLYVPQCSYGTFRKTCHEDLKVVYFSVAMVVYFWMVIYTFSLVYF